MSSEIRVEDLYCCANLHTGALACKNAGPEISLLDTTCTPWTNLLYRHQSKMSSFKKITCKGTLRQVFIVLSPLPLPTLTHCIRVYCKLIHKGKGRGRDEPDGRLERHQLTMLGRKYQHD
jgi:hypothetical protein